MFYCKVAVLYNLAK